ncbi:MAG TPA: polysaccharide biosynthesis tyrosine autokinase [Anaerolineae bacterium]|nr:polysaccharide biosynthesis tyrosine autokinase [Anaerolineae bacterium]
MRLNGKSPGVFALDDPKSLVSEAFRTLRTNLQFSSLDAPLRSLVVSSTLAAEGKTTTAANLAVVWAQAGKRVILIDADLRRPAVHKMFGLPNRKGLTTLLVAESGPLSSHLQKTSLSTLQLLTSGPIPPNPQELLGSQRMEDLLRVLERRADIVILDTPPCLVVADANVLASRTDGVLLVVDTGHTRRAAIYQAVEGLQNVNARILGAVLNMVDTRRGRGYYYYSYYAHYYQEDGRDGRPRKWPRLGRRSDRRGKRSVVKSQSAGR